MRNFKFSLPLAALFVIGMVFTACQKDNIVTEASKQNRFYSGCIAPDGESTSTLSSGDYNSNHYSTVAISNTADELVFKFSSNRPIHFIAIDGVEIICSPTTAIAQPYEHRIPIGEYLVDWIDGAAMSFEITTYRNNCMGGGGGNSVTYTANHSLVGVCDDECEIRDETAYAGNTVGERITGQGGNAAWWYAFDTQEDATQTVWAAQDENAGTATFNGTSIVISLENGWQLEAGSETVKWYSYNDLPTDGRPTPGQAPNKGNSLTINTNGARYYVIHLDLEICE